MNGLRAVVAIATVELRRFLADRANIFFVFIFPMILVLVIGSQFGGAPTSGRVALVGPESSLRTALTQQLTEDEMEVSTMDEDQMRESVARGGTDLGVVLDSADETAYHAGEPSSIEVVPSSQATGQAAMQVLRTAAQAVAVQAGQEQALRSTDADDGAIDTALTDAREEVAPVRLQVKDQSELAEEFAGLSGQFDQGASSQLLLFVFLTSLAGSATLIVARRNGVIRRTLAAPVSVPTALVGQAAGRWVIAVFQGLYIMLATALLFDVDWGNPWLTGLVLMVFSVVAAGAAMLLAVLFDNEGAASGAGVGVGLVLAALGGCMLPLELFPDTMRTIANFTPHTWAYVAMADIQRRGAGLVDILPQLGVLLGMAAVLLALGAWALRRSLSRAM